MKKQKFRKKTLGIVIFLVNLFWIWHFADLYYKYHFADILWLLMYPDWVLMTNITIGLIGVYLAVRLILNKIEIKQTLLVEIPAFFIELFLSQFYWWFY